MQLELTQKQADTIVEALGIALTAIPPIQRVAVSAMEYAPIVQILQQAAQPALTEPVIGPENTQD